MTDNYYSHSDTIVHILKKHFQHHGVNQCFDAVGWAAGRASGL